VLNWVHDSEILVVILDVHTPEYVKDYMGDFSVGGKERHVRDAVQYRNPSLQFRASHDHGRSLFALYGYLTTERIQECVSDYTMYLLHTLRYPIPIARSNAMLNGAN
jgi:hypothetical protein